MDDGDTVPKQKLSVLPADVDSCPSEDEQQQQLNHHPSKEKLRLSRAQNASPKRAPTTRRSTSGMIHSYPNLLKCLKT